MPRYPFHWFSFLTLPRCKHDGSFMTLYQNKKVIGCVYVYIKRYLWCLRFWMEFWAVLTCKYFWFPFYYHYFRCPSRGVRYHFLIGSGKDWNSITTFFFRLSIFYGQKIYMYLIYTILLYGHIGGKWNIEVRDTFCQRRDKHPQICSRSSSRLEKLFFNAMISSLYHKMKVLSTRGPV